MPAVPAYTHVHTMTNMPYTPVFHPKMPPSNLNCPLSVVNILHLSREFNQFENM